MRAKFLVLVPVVLTVVAVFGSSQASATLIIVSDTFTGLANDQSISTRQPETNLPGGTYIDNVDYGTYSGYVPQGWADDGNPASCLRFGNMGAFALSLAGSGGYSKPTTLTVTADLKTDSDTGVAAGRGIGLGFYDSVNPSTRQYPTNHFTGLVLDDAGNLTLTQDPNDTGFFTGAGTTSSPVIAYVGTWDVSAFHTLSYTVDTATGNISNVSLSGSTADYSGLNSTTLFAGAATNYLGAYYSSMWHGYSKGYLDNLTVTTVPEPSVMALLVTGLMGLLAYAWRKRR